MASADSVIVKDPQILGGEPVFRNTRVPFQALIDYLEGGQSLDEFLSDFPTVTRDAAIASLEEAKSLILAQLG
ncbi:MAG TPA: DUF433 domain-containing protein [Candidatus Angelobacter sp.]|jgi:uncharacterized protein (DUF433 family)|nr:DUF433 domain-containing protein [Candidatus Angelobacter sp.]